MTDEKILTLHPQGKNGKNISKRTYDTVKRAMLAVLKGVELTHAELMERLKRALSGEFAGNVSWYGETLKLDLEARGLVERTAAKPQRYRLRKPPRRAGAAARARRRAVKSR
jgi:hypothetical protein